MTHTLHLQRYHGIYIYIYIYIYNYVTFNRNSMSPSLFTSYRIDHTCRLLSTSYLIRAQKISLNEMLSFQHSMKNITSPITYKQAITGNYKKVTETCQKNFKSEEIKLTLRFVQYCRISRITSIAEITAIFGCLVNGYKETFPLHIICWLT